MCDDSIIEFQRYSLKQYTSAVKHTHMLLAQSAYGGKNVVIKGLVACILFICYENLLANFTMAQMHLQNGLKILAKYTSATTDGN